MCELAAVLAMSVACGKFPPIFHGSHYVSGAGPWGRAAVDLQPVQAAARDAARLSRVVRRRPTVHEGAAAAASCSINSRTRARSVVGVKGLGRKVVRRPGAFSSGMRESE